MRRDVRQFWLGLPLALALLGIGPPSGTEAEPAPEAAPEAAREPAARREVPHAERYETNRAGHPLRIVAYALHPVGVILDYLIFRPAHWVGSHEPIRTLVGQDD